MTTDVSDSTAPRRVEMLKINQYFSASKSKCADFSRRGMEGKAKVLCLHGFTQNGETFRAKTGSIRKNLKSKIEFVFVDAPHSAAGFFDEHDRGSLGTGDGNDDAGPRAWWLMGENDEEDGGEAGTKDDTVTEALTKVKLGETSKSAVADTDGPMSSSVDTNDAPEQKTETKKVRPAQSTSMTGWSATETVIRDACTHHGPFTGVIGFSQGASTAALALATMPELKTVKWMVLFSGFEPRDEKARAWLRKRDDDTSSEQNQSAINTPAIRNVRSLHVHGTLDAMVTKEQTIALMNAFRETPELFEHDGGHGIPSSKPFRERMKQFVLEVGEG